MSQNHQIGEFTFSLFKRPTFGNGFSAIADFGDTVAHYNTSKTETEADLKALKSDWCATGFDMIEAMKMYESKSRELELAAK